MNGYFKVSMEAARALAAESDSPELLAAYLVICSHAYGADRDLSAAGAKAIRKRTGCTDYRSKRLFSDLRSLCFGDKGEQSLIQPTGWKKANADVYRLTQWQGAYAYLPGLLVTHGLERICADDASPLVVRDGLLMLLRLYEAVDYGGWMGASPDLFPYQEWDIEGARELDNFDATLGYQDDAGGLGLWLVAPPADGSWTARQKLAEELFGTPAATLERVWPALWWLMQSGFACCVAVVSEARQTYPLWVFSQAYRELLASAHGIHADLARSLSILAIDAGLDPDNQITRAGLEAGTEGTGVFFCCANAKPIVRTVLAPRLHAPTPVNLDGLTEQAKVTQRLKQTVTKAKQRSRAAA